MSHHAHAMLDVPATLSVAIVALVYLRGWLGVRTISGGRLAAFMAGLASVWIAIGSPLTAFHHQLLSVHMVQHVLLMAVAPPLMLIGTPAQILRRIVVHPVVCWLAPVAALIAWHVPSVFELGVHSRWWHDVQAASFLGTGLLFWAPVVHWPASLPTAPRWWIPLYLFAATLPCDALSAFLVFCDRVVYPSYRSGSTLFNVSPLGDQEFAGALMWVSVTLIYLVPASLITLQLLSPPGTGEPQVG